MSCTGRRAPQGWDGAGGRDADGAGSATGSGRRRFAARIDLHVAIPRRQFEIGQVRSIGVAAHRGAGGVVVHHEKEEVAFGHQPGHVFLGDEFRRRPEGQTLELLGQFAGLHFGLVAQPGEGLAGGVGALEGVPVNQGEAGRFAGILQEAAEKGQQGAADPTDADGFYFHSEQ